MTDDTLRRLFLVVGLSGTQLWATWYAHPWLGLGAALLAVLRPLRPDPPPPSVRPLPPFGKGPWLLLALLCPTAVGVRYLTREFPFSGDHAHHLAAVEIAWNFLRTPEVAAAMALSLATAAWLRRGTPRAGWGMGLWVGTLFFLSRALVLPAPFTRYPGLVYSLTAPVHGLFSLWMAPPLLAPLVWVNLLAFPAYLYLRRSVLRLEVDASTLWLVGCLGALPSVAHYAGANYLEAWPLALTLLALEAHLEVARGGNLPNTLPLFFGALASLAKDPYLMVPLVLVVTWGFYPQVKTLPPCRRVWGWAQNAATFLFPFACFLWLREAGNRPLLSLLSVDQLLSWDRLQEWFFRWNYELGPPGLALLLGACALIAYHSLRSPTGRLTWGPLAVLVGAQVSYFWVHGVTLYWTGYPRFHLLSLACLALFLQRTFLHLPQRSRKPWAVAFVFAVAWGATRTVGTLFLPDGALNFQEHYDAPLRVPLRPLFREALAHLPPRSPVQVAAAEFHPHWRHLPRAYPDVHRAHPFELVPWRDPDSLCRCQSGSPPQLLLFPRLANLQTRPAPRSPWLTAQTFPRQPPPDPTAAHLPPHCLQALEDSCARVWRQPNSTDGKTPPPEAILTLPHNASVVANQ